MKINILYITLIVSLLLYSCAPTKIINIDYSKNLAPLYNPSRVKIHPDYTIYHRDSITDYLMFKLYNNQFMFSAANQQTKPMAKVLIYCKILNSIDSMMQLDSVSTLITLKKDSSYNSVSGYMKLPVPKTKKYVLQITTTDMYKHKMGIKFIQTDKKHTDSENFFMLKDNSGHTILTPYIKAKTTVRIYYEYQPVDTLFVKYYKLRNRLPTPPFSSIMPDDAFPEPDTILKIKYYAGVALNIDSAGIYFIQKDTTSKRGKAIICFASDFPTPETVKGLYEPLRYLSKREEYKNIETYPVKKLAVDNFWLDAGKNPNTARTLIKIYYNRVKFANKHFSSYKKGWLTDRGMIYIVLGVPKVVHFYDNKEEWIYADSRNVNVYYFIFKHKKHPFSSNHYILERKTEFNKIWYDAVNSWRNGKVYSLEYR